LNKNDLIASVASSTGLSKSDAGKAVESVISTISSSLKQGTEVRISGFGAFVVKTRAASVGRNPRTGEQIQISSSRQAKFKAGKSLKEAVK